MAVTYCCVLAIVLSFSICIYAREMLDGFKCLPSPGVIILLYICLHLSFLYCIPLKIRYWLGWENIIIPINSTNSLMLNQREFLVLCLPDKLLFWFPLRKTKASCTLGGCLAGGVCCGSREEGVSVREMAFSVTIPGTAPAVNIAGGSPFPSHCKCSSSRSNARQNGWAAVLYKNDLNPALILFLRISLKSLQAPSWRLSGVVAVEGRAPGPTTAGQGHGAPKDRRAPAWGARQGRIGLGTAGCRWGGMDMDRMWAWGSPLPEERLPCWCPPPPWSSGRWRVVAPEGRRCPPLCKQKSRNHKYVRIAQGSAWL